MIRLKHNEGDKISWAAEHCAAYGDDPETMSENDLITYHDSNCSICR